MRGRRNTPADIWSFIPRGGPDDCWEWTGTRDRDGYGRIFIVMKNTPAHRIAFELGHGVSAAGLQVLHRCDNPPCCNPAHLFLGTNTENHADKLAKGRQARGEGLGQSRLTEDQIREIRELARAGLSQRKLAARFGVTQPNIGFICRRETWRHVT